MTTTIRRGALVWTLDGAPARVTSTKGGYIFTSAGGPYGAWQLTTTPPDPIAAAQSFVAAQTAAMRSWSDDAMPSRRDHETALSLLGALLEVVA